MLHLRSWIRILNGIKWINETKCLSINIVSVPQNCSGTLSETCSIILQIVGKIILCWNIKTLYLTHNDCDFVNHVTCWITKLIQFRFDYVEFLWIWLWFYHFTESKIKYYQAVNTIPGKLSHQENVMFSLH